MAALAAALAAAALAAQLVELFSEQAVTTAGSNAERPSAPERPVPDIASSARQAGTSSNIYRYDYVGPEACGRCHGGIYDLWRTHPHSRMNSNATALSVVGDFSGTRLAYADGSVEFAKSRGELTMTLFRRDRLVRRFKVTRTVGSRFVQMYIGVQTEGPEQRDDAIYTEEVKLPFAYWIERRQWFPETYDETPAVPEYDERGELTAFYAFHGKPRSAWKRTCIKCHNTYPYALRFEAGPDGKLLGFPRADVSLASDAPGRAGGRGMPELEPWELVTLGISCESCHFGGREHALQGASIRFLPRSEELRFPKATEELAREARRSPYVINSICGQCHAADTQGPVYPDGAASWNSREARDLTSGACASEISCTNCHNPHEPGPVSGGGADAGRHNEACLGCHERLRAPGAKAAHTAHPEGSQVSCLDCHMPRIVHGLSGMIRSHHISSPTDPRMLKEGYPNACNLCHLDRPLGWTLDALEARWGRRVDLGSDWKPSDEPVGTAWLKHPQAIVRQVAAAAYARSPAGRAALGQVLPILNDESPPGRMFGMLAVERLLGRPLGPEEYSPWDPPEVRARKVAELSRQGP